MWRFYDDIYEFDDRNKHFFLNISYETIMMYLEKYSFPSQPVSFRLPLQTVEMTRDGSTCNMTFFQNTLQNNVCFRLQYDVTKSIYDCVSFVDIKDDTIYFDVFVNIKIVRAWNVDYFKYSVKVEYLSYIRKLPHSDVKFDIDRFVYDVNISEYSSAIDFKDQLYKSSIYKRIEQTDLMKIIGKTMFLRFKNYDPHFLKDGFYRCGRLPVGEWKYNYKVDFSDGKSVEFSYRFSRVLIDNEKF